MSKKKKHKKDEKYTSTVLLITSIINLTAALVSLVQVILTSIN